MPVPTIITDLSDIAASNFPQDTDSTGSTVAELPRQLSAIIKKQFISATSVTITTGGQIPVPVEGSYITVFGTGFNMSSMSNCYNGRVLHVRFRDAGLVLQNTAAFAMPTGGDITTQANDTATFINESAGVWRCVSYPRAIKSASSFAPGTKMVFMQASAPVGWTIATSFNDKLLYINSTTGGALGGTHNPIENDKVPSHTHPASTTSVQPAHEHNNVTYSGTASGLNRVSASNSNGAAYSTAISSSVAPTISSSTTVSANAGASTWQPRYAAGMVCTKD